MNLTIFLVSFIFGIILLPICIFSIISFFICGFYGNKVLEDINEDISVELNRGETNRKK